MTIQKTGVFICERFGLTKEDAQNLVEIWLKPDWLLLTSKNEGENLTIGDMYVKVLRNGHLTENEKCFLCSHLASNFELFELREYFRGEPQKFLQRLGLIQ